MTFEISWNKILSQLIDKHDLSRREAAWAMEQIMSGESSEVLITAFMLALRSKGESVEELSGLVDVMLKNSVLIDTGSDAVDIVGTGGDLVGTVNISSMASILASAAGVPVLKHGSRSASGKTGSSEMLEVLGVRLDLSPQKVAQVFHEVGLTFFFAPVFHPAMRHVAAIRKQLGVPTTFNFLGPLANPAQPVATSLGVANEAIAPLLAEELSNRGRHALVFRGNDGLDELTTTTSSRVWQVSPGQVYESEINPTRFGFKPAKLQDLIGGDPRHNAEIARRLLSGDTSGQLGAVREITILNAAGGVAAYRAAKDTITTKKDIQEQLSDAIQVVTENLDSGNAALKLQQWTSATQS